MACAILGDVRQGRRSCDKNHAGSRLAGGIRLQAWHSRPKPGRPRGQLARLIPRSNIEQARARFASARGAEPSRRHVSSAASRESPEGVAIRTRGRMACRVYVR